MSATASSLRFESLEDRRLLAAGDLDLTFGDGGLVTTDFGYNDDQAMGSALQSDGKLIVVGLTADEYRDFAVVRYNTDGSSDETFGEGGRVMLDLGGNDDAFDVVVQADGKIVVAGRSDAEGWEFALVRLEIDGSLDTTFGSEGVVKTDVGPGVDYGLYVVLQTDGKIVVVGDNGGGSNWNVAVARYNTDGRLDTTFSDDGKLILPVGSGDNSIVGGLALQDDGKILVGTRKQISSEDFDMAVARVDTNGELDATFGTGGIATTPTGQEKDYLTGLAVQPDGKILVAGNTYRGSDYDCMLFRLDTDGSLDTTFAAEKEGRLVFPIGEGDDLLYDMRLQANGKIVVVGATDTGEHFDFVVGRFKTDGSPDTLFGSAGIVTTDFTSGSPFFDSYSERAMSLEIQDDGKLVASGYTYAGENYDFAVARYDGDWTSDEPPTVYDFGDAYDDLDPPVYPTLLANDGARHVIVPGVHLGASIDADANGQVRDGGLDGNSRAMGDDLDSQGDDDDGVVFTSAIIAGQTATVDVTASTAGFLQGWMDFYANEGRDWDDPGEQIFTNQPLSEGVNSLSFAVPADAQGSEYSMARFRFSTAADVGPTGLAPDGEVEDYVWVLDTVARDYGDAPDYYPNKGDDVVNDYGYDTLLMNDGARHGVVPGFSIGPTVDVDYDGQPDSSAQGDDLNGDDEDGVVVNTPLVRGANAQITVNVTDEFARNGFVSAWLLPADEGWPRSIISNHAVVPGENPISFQVPEFFDMDRVGEHAGTAYLRVRLSTQWGLNADGPAPDGEVEDYLVTLAAPNVVDFGDAPYPYRTESIDFGPQHTIVGGFHLGAKVDGESRPRNLDNRAEGDDRDNHDDDDGVVFDTPIVPDQQTDVTVTLTGDAGRLDAWIDLNRDGDWQDGEEKVFFSESLVSGPNSLSFTLPEGTAVGNTFMRFRLSTSGTPGPLDNDGPRPTGEVEDYMVTIEPPTGLVVINEIDSVGSPGYDEFIELYDGGTGSTSLSGHVVVLYDGDTDTSYAAYDLDAVSTNADGYYTLSPVTLQDGNDAVALYYADAADFPNGTPVSTLNLIDAIVYGDSYPYDEGLKDLLMREEGQRNENGLEGQATHSLGRAPGDFLPRIIETYGPHVPTPGGENFPLHWDYGDVPNLSFPTREDEYGARHLIMPEFHLGSSVDGEGGAQYLNVSSSDAIGDDTNLVYPGVPYPAGDEDGVTFGGPFTLGTQVPVAVTMTDGTGAGGKLDAWLDFNGDGDWSDAGEQVFTGQSLTAGVNQFTIDVPMTANPGHSFARFRLSRAGGLSFDGAADNGEVEDYRVTLVYEMVVPDKIGAQLDTHSYFDANDNGTWDGRAGGDARGVFVRDGETFISGAWTGGPYDYAGSHYGSRFRVDFNGNGRWDGVAGGDKQFFFGFGGATPVIGDWNGDGVDEIGCHYGKNFLLDLNGNGVWDGRAGGDANIPFGITGVTPLAGDWNGDGTDNIGFYTGTNFYLDFNGNGIWDGRAGGDRNYVFASAGTLPIVGDWNGDGADQVGEWLNKSFYFDYDGNGRWNGPEGGDEKHFFPPNAPPIIGKWEPAAVPENLVAARRLVEAPADQPDVPPLTMGTLTPVVEFAMAVAAQLPLTASQTNDLAHLEVRIADLPGAELGWALGTRITLDVDAAGWGWNLGLGTRDEGRGSDDAGLSRSDPGPWTLDPGPKMDLLTAVMHEIGHVLGYDHDDHGVMQDELPPDVRHVWDELDSAFSGDLDLWL